MDGTAEDLLEKWEAMLEDESIWLGVPRSLGQKIVDINKEQLLDGLDINGELLPTYKHYDLGNGKTYSDLKRSMNPRNGGRYDMRYSGRSFDSMRIEIDSSRYKIISDGWAGAYNRGSVEFAKNLRGKILGVPDNDLLQYYREQYQYPIQTEMIKQTTGVK